MRLFALTAIVSTLGLTACVPLSIYYREGVSVSRAQKDTLACEVRALKDAPVANQTRITPPRWVPQRQSCNSSGQCTVIPGYFLPGESYTVDVNAGLRQRVETQCMANKGYAPVDIPACPDRIAKAAPPGATTRLPALTSASCVIKNADGTYQIVNKG